MSQWGVLVRELVYLSDEKLRQFLPEPVPRWRRAGRFKAEVKAPIGSISLDSRSSDKSVVDRDHIEKVINHVALSAKWFEAEGLRAGEWIFFEDWLNYRILQRHGKRTAVVFLNLFPSSRTPRRLLLHGSAKHLLGPATSSEKQVFRGPSYSDGRTFVDSLRILPNLTRPVDISTDLEHFQQPKGDEGPLPANAFESGIMSMISALDLYGSFSAETAAWMTGYARLTGRFSTTFEPETLVASPLYVELRPPPDDDDPYLRPVPKMIGKVDKLPADSPLRKAIERYQVRHSQR